MTPQGSGLLGPFVAAGLTFLSGTAVMMGFNKLDEPGKKPVERRDDGIRPSAQAMQDASPDMEKFRAKVVPDLDAAFKFVPEQLDAEKICAKVFAEPVDVPKFVPGNGRMKEAAAPAQDEGEAMAALFNAAASKQRNGGNGPAPTR